MTTCGYPCSRIHASLSLLLSFTCAYRVYLSVWVRGHLVQCDRSSTMMLQKSTSKASFVGLCLTSFSFPVHPLYCCCILANNRKVMVSPPLLSSRLSLKRLSRTWRLSMVSSACSAWSAEAASTSASSPPYLLTSTLRLHAYYMFTICVALDGKRLTCDPLSLTAADTLNYCLCVNFHWYLTSFIATLFICVL